MRANITELDRLKTDERVALRHLAYVVREFLKGGMDRTILQMGLDRVDTATKRLSAKTPFGAVS